MLSLLQSIIVNYEIEFQNHKLWRLFRDWGRERYIRLFVLQFHLEYIRLQFIILNLLLSIKKLVYKQLQCRGHKALNSARQSNVLNKKSDFCLSRSTQSNITLVIKYRMKYEIKWNRKLSYYSGHTIPNLLVKNYKTKEIIKWIETENFSLSWSTQSHIPLVIAVAQTPRSNDPQCDCLIGSVIGSRLLGKSIKLIIKGCSALSFPSLFINSCSFLERYSWLELFTADRKYVIAFVTQTKKESLLLFGVRVEKDLDLTEIFLIGSQCKIYIRIRLQKKKIKG